MAEFAAVKIRPLRATLPFEPVAGRPISQPAAKLGSRSLSGSAGGEFKPVTNMSLIKIKEEPRRSSWRRKSLLVLAGIAVFVVVLYFVATSAAFLKGVILPRVSDALKADVTVAEAEISPFRHVVLREVKVNPRGSEPLLTVREIRLRYSLWSILHGKIEVEEVTVDSPVFTVVENPDGRSNLDALLKLGSKEKSPTQSSPTTPQVNIKLVSLTNATVRFVQNHLGGAPDVAEVSGLNFGIRDLKNGQSGKLELAASLAVDRVGPATTGSLRARIAGGFGFALTPDLKPAAITGNTTFMVERATGVMAELSALGARFDCDVTSNEVKQVAVRFTKADATLGEVRASGLLDLAKLEGKLKLEMLSLDRRVLNLAGAAQGIDFGPTTINSTTDLEFTKGGTEISVAGRLNVANLQVSQAGKTSPTLDLRCDYAVGVNQAAGTAVLKFLNLSGTQNSQLFLQSELPKPFPFAWGNAGGATLGDATFNLAVTGWNLADWQALAGAAAPTGLVNAKLRLDSHQNGKLLQLEVTGGVDNFGLKAGSNQVSGVELHWQAKAQATELKQFKLEEYRLEIAQQGQAALVVTASGTFDGATQDADLQVAVQATLARLAAIATRTGVNVSAGMVEFKSHVVAKGGNQTATGQLALTDFSGGQGSLQLTNYGAALDFDVTMKDNTLELRKVAGLVRSGTNNGGRFDASGTLNLGDQMNGQVAVKLADFNQEGLRPFLESALGGKQLVSVALYTTVAVNFGRQGDMGIKADLQVTNLVVRDASNPQPATPLQTRVQVDVTVAGAIAEIRQCQLTLTPTDRAKNELSLAGRVDASKPNAITGNLKLGSASFDATRYYDLLEGKSTPAAPANGATAAAASGAAPTNSEQEPAAVALPFQNFTFDVALDRFYLREVDIAKLHATARLDGGQVVVKPCALTLNGAPISATVDCDLSLPGYKYDIGFKVEAIPFAPLVNSFAPDRKGQLGGTITASAQLKGAGITGVNLQKNLAGRFDVAATNLNLSIANVRSPLLKTLVNVIVGIPELIRNPTAVLEGLLGGLTGSATSKPGWTQELNASPINVILARGTAGTGRVQL